MSTLIITLFCGLFSWRFVYPPLAVLCFIFFDFVTTPGTASAMPFTAYTGRMAWGGLIGAALASMTRLYQTRNTGSGGRFAWRVGAVCVLMVVLIRLSRVIGTGHLDVQNDTGSVGPLVLIITLAYLHDRRAWWCFGFMLVVQLCLSVYVIAYPESRFNGANATAVDMHLSADLLSPDSEVGFLGTRVRGQFSNTITMAVHAAVGVAAGLTLLGASRRWGFSKKKVVAILAGLGLASAGAYLLGVSATRGVMLGLIFGLMVHFFRIRGSVRLPLFVGTVLGVLVVAPFFADLLPEESLLWGRFAMLRDLKGTEDYRLIAMRYGLDAIMSNPFVGAGDFIKGLDACTGYMPHIGPYYLAVLYGIPVGLLACVVLFWAGRSDLTAANVRAANAVPAFRELCAFGTICCWTAMGCILTNGYAGTVIIYISLGIAMWPLVYRHPVSHPMIRYRSC